MSTGTPIAASGNAGDGAQQKAQEIAGQAQEKAQEAAAQAKGKLREQLDQRSSQVAEQVNEQASDLRAVAQSLRQQGKEGPATAADRLAQYGEKFSGYLRDKDREALLNDVEDFARRQPWAVGGGALALGFAAARFLKASSRERYSSRTASGRHQTAAPPAGGASPSFAAPRVGSAPGAPPVGPGPAFPPATAPAPPPASAPAAPTPRG